MSRISNVMSYNTIEHEGHKFTPYELIFDSVKSGVIEITNSVCNNCVYYMYIYIYHLFGVTIFVLSLSSISLECRLGCNGVRQSVCTL